MVGFFQVHFPLVLLCSPGVVRYFLLNLLSCTPEPFSVCYSFCSLLLLHVLSVPLFFFSFFLLSISPSLSHFPARPPPPFFLSALISLACKRDQELLYFYFMYSWVLFVSILCVLNILPFPSCSLTLFLFGRALVYGIKCEIWQN